EKIVYITPHDTTAIKAYAKASVITTRPYFESIVPAGEGVDPSNNNVDIILVDSDTTVNTSSISLSFDGTPVTPTVIPNSPTAGRTRINFNLGVLTRNTEHTLTVQFLDSSELVLQKTWSF